LINYAVIGCGVIGKVHCSAIESDPQSYLLFVCDINARKADELADLFNCRASYNYNKLLQNPDVDAITICLPHSMHVKLFEKALLQGKHVVCEKPLATTPRDIYKMVELSENSIMKTTAAFQHRHSPLIGKLETLINQALHTIDLANVFLGKPESLSGIVENRSLSDIEVEDFAFGQIIYEKNRTLSLTAINSKDESWKPILKIKGSKGSFILEGSDSLIDLDVNSTDVLNELSAIETKMKEDKSLPGKKCYGNLHNLVISDFSEAVINNRKPYVSIKDASIANEIVLGFYYSTSKKDTVSFPIKEYRQPILR
jgi:UDP-N-acetyl-2-amino-2-deoxyglucuronate dehydrogenase